MRKQILVKYHHPQLLPIWKTPQGDWIDLRSAETVLLKAGETYKISLGVSMKLPKGYEAHVKPRSSTYKHWKILLVNSVGTIDESYCGNDDVWCFHAYATEDTTIKFNDRICQFRIEKKQPKLIFKTKEYLKDPNRGGWGSTGKD